MLPYGYSEFADHVPLRTHLHGVERRHLTVPHGKVLMVLSAWHNVLGARFLEERRPGIGIEMLRLEHGDEVLISELFRRPEVLCVPRASTAWTVIDSTGHIVSAQHFQNTVIPARIQELLVPLIAVRRHREDTKVHKDTELCSFEPGRHLVVLLERLPCWFHRSGSHRRRDLLDGILHHALAGLRGHIETQAVPTLPCTLSGQVRRTVHQHGTGDRQNRAPRRSQA